ncbi:MAG: PH domain-containing protein [Pedobacter sp.]|uniref:PH domain-containing protein n=1 Tax=Pedobacter sp. TaxID=1411316 RepID=UPI002809D332|nr:PH domain-containing protein [Pedobacter sp.]MDQ8003247.1 PH domain-containing protein [Pedobacter sp.]
MVDFSEPQRQSAAGIIINGAYIVQRFVRAMFIPLALFIFKSNKVALLYTAFGLAAILIISLIYGYFYYRKFTFYLDTLKREFVIDKGVFGRKNLTIPVEKIQQVNINQGFLQKLIGVYSLQIDTAGSDSKEVNISAISGPIAFALKEHLLNGEKETVSMENGEELVTPQNLQKETPFIKISAATLLKIGLTSNYGQSIVLLLGFGYAVFHNIKEVLKAFDNDHGQVEQFFKSGVTIISVGVLLAAIIFILLATNVIRTFVKYFDFQMSKHQKSLLISSGLLAKKNTLLHPNKVQITEYSQNYFQKKIGLFNMALKQAHSGQQQSEKEVRTNNMEVPGCSPAEKDEVLKMILSKLPEDGTRYKPNFRFMNLPIIFSVILPLAGYLIFYQVIPEVRAFYPLAILYVLVASLMTYISYTKHRITVSEDFIIKQSGIWDISQEIIEPHKIQSISTSQFPWHKSLDIGHVTLHTAAGSIAFSYGNYTEIKTLVNWWLYQVESGQKDWM